VVVIGAFSLLVGTFGTTYVGYRAVFSVRSGRPPECGVLVYAAGASGNAGPLERIIIGRGGNAGFVTGLALDSHGELLVSALTSTNAILVYASPDRHPTIVRTITGPAALKPEGLWINPFGELYVDNISSPNPGASYVAALPASAGGQPTPDREISVVSQKSLGEAIVTGAGILFVPDSLANAVYEVYAAKGGQQTPIFTLSTSSPSDVKLGK
jgi:hypothetical protein